MLSHAGLEALPRKSVTMPIVIIVAPMNYMYILNITAA